MSEQDDTLFNFPCDFPIKIMGHANDEFEVAVLTIIRKHFPNISETALNLRESKEGKYLSVTVTVTADSREQLDAVYLELNAHHTVIMTL